MNINLPINLKLKGEIDLQIIDTNTNTIKEQRVFKNMLLTGYLDNLFVREDYNLLRWGPSDGSLITSGAKACIGTGNITPTVNDSGLYGLLAYSTGSYFVAKSTNGVTPVWKKVGYLFNTGINATIREIGLSGITSDGGANAFLARQLISPEINILDTDKIIAAWTIYVDFGSLISNGTIINGQRDGTTNINWTGYINKTQMMTHVMRTSAPEVYSNNQNSNNAWGNLFIVPTNVGNPYIYYGTSNSASNLNTDGHYTIKGTALNNGTSIGKQIAAYTLGSFFRETSLNTFSVVGLTTSNGASQIGEMVVSSSADGSVSSSYGGLFRITFNPRLDRTTTSSFLLKIKIGVSQ